MVTPHRVVAKVSRTEVARKFFAPAPAKMLAELVARGDLTEEQARMAETVPVAQDLTVEADSGGHTDNRPAITLLPDHAGASRSAPGGARLRRPLACGFRWRRFDATFRGCRRSPWGPITS